MGIDIGGTKCAVLLGRAQGDADDIIIGVCGIPREMRPI